jgi:hypothetical protein
VNITLLMARRLCTWLILSTKLEEFSSMFPRLLAVVVFNLIAGVGITAKNDFLG